MPKPNLKIPLILIQKYKLSPLAILLYGELNGLYSKYHMCNITDNELSQRLNRSVSRIQHGLSELKNNSLIFSKQKPDYKGRSILVSRINDKPFILIPIPVIRRKDLAPNALLVYGSLYSKVQKQAKINIDKKINDNNPVIIISKSDIAQELDITSRSINRILHELADKHYIFFNPVNGVGVEINLNNIDSIPTFWSDNLGQKREATYDRNEKPPRTKTGTHLGQKRETNKVLININKEIDLHQSSQNKDQSQINTALEEYLCDPFHSIEELQNLPHPIYYNSLPEETNMPPEAITFESINDIQDLNKLDAEHSTTHPHKTQKYNNTAKSGSETGKVITPYISAFKTKTDQTSNKDAQSVNSVANIDHQCKKLMEILKRKTNKKNYTLTTQNKYLIEYRLMNGNNLNDFESAIDYLIQQGNTISIRDLALNLPNYLNKIESKRTDRTS